MMQQLDLIGDGIENPWNVKAMLAAASMFGAECSLRDRKKLLESNPALLGNSIAAIQPEELNKYSSLIAMENLPHAEQIYGFSIPKGNTPTALVVGNERFGISKEVLNASTHFVEIPMCSKTLNTINVAAASAVGLYYLHNPVRSKIVERANPEPRRPAILMMAPSNQFEVGSALRSAAAFGWTEVLLEDRRNVWFNCNRGQRAEGRAAARRARNAIRIMPFSSEARCSFKYVTVISTREGVPLRNANLARGKDQLLVLPDEMSVQLGAEDWGRLGTHVEFVRIETKRTEFAYDFRLAGSIAMAEGARQIGRKPHGKPSTRHRLHYHHAIEFEEMNSGELIYVDELCRF